MVVEQQLRTRAEIFTWGYKATFLLLYSNRVCQQTANESMERAVKEHQNGFIRIGRAIELFSFHSSKKQQQQKRIVCGGEFPHDTSDLLPMNEALHDL